MMSAAGIAIIAGILALVLSLAAMALMWFSGYMSVSAVFYWRAFVVWLVFVVMAWASVLWQITLFVPQDRQ